MRLALLFLAFVFLASGVPDARAQSADWWDWAARSERRSERDTDRDRRDRDDEWDDDRYEDQDDRGRDGRARGNRDGRRNDRRARKNDGPKFCRNGQGHPTQGMQWCRDKGWAPYGSVRRDERRAPRWERRTVEDIIFGTPRRTDRRDDRRRTTVSNDVLRDILGSRRYTQLSRVSDGRVAARWVYPTRTTRVLQIRDGRGPLAELTDYDGDGRVDVFLTNGRR